jgi:hypothetical protein
LQLDESWKNIARAHQKMKEKKGPFACLHGVGLDNISLELEMGLVVPVAIQVGPTEPNRDPIQVDVGHENSEVPQDSVKDALLRQENMLTQCH